MHGQNGVEGRKCNQPYRIPKVQQRCGLSSEHREELVVLHAGVATKVVEQFPGRVIVRICSLCGDKMH